MRNKKRGLSSVVATVLLILISFLAILVVWKFILPMIRGNLEEGSTCFELREHAKIMSSDFTCHNNSRTSIMIQREMNNLSFSGFRVSIMAGGSSEVYDLENGKATTGVKTYGKSDDLIVLPAPGGAKTYIFEIADGSKAKLGIITSSGKVCEVYSADIPLCM